MSVGYLRNDREPSAHLFLKKKRHSADPRRFHPHLQALRRRPEPARHGPCRACRRRTTSWTPAVSSRSSSSSAAARAAARPSGTLGAPPAVFFCFRVSSAHADGERRRARSTRRVASERSRRGPSVGTFRSGARCRRAPRCSGTKKSARYLGPHQQCPACRSILSTRARGGESLPTAAELDAALAQHRLFRPAERGVISPNASALADGERWGPAWPEGA